MAESRKLYAGVKLRELRARLGLTQAEYAAKLGVSLSYLNQMENNHRPVSARVVLALAVEFGLDVAELGAGSTERMVADMREALADPVFGPVAPPLGDIQLVAANAPALARAFLTLHHAHRQTQERLAHLNEALGREDGALVTLPWEEVRDFFITATTISTPSTAPPSASPPRSAPASAARRWPPGSRRGTGSRSGSRRARPFAASIRPPGGSRSRPRPAPRRSPSRSCIRSR